MASVKPLQIKIDENVLSKAQLFAEYEGFRSVASMAHYAFIQFLNTLEDKKIKKFTPTQEEKLLLQEAEDDIQSGRLYRLDMDKFHELFD